MLSVLGLVPFSCGLFLYQWRGRKRLSNNTEETLCAEVHRIR